MKGINNSYDYNVVEYKTPYKKFLSIAFRENKQTMPYLYVICKKAKGNTSQFYTRSELISKDIDYFNMEVESSDIYDCDRMMEGFVRALLFDPNYKFKNSEIKWIPPNEDTIGEIILKNICTKLELNGRF